MKARRLLAVRFLLAMCLVAGLRATPTGTLTALDIGPVTGPNTVSSLFTFDFTIGSLSSFSAGPFVSGPTSFGYLNVVQNGQWLVQNELIPLVPDAIGINSHSWFDNASTTVTPTFAIINDTAYSATPIVDASWTGFVPAGTSSDWGSNDPQGQTQVAIPAGPPPAAAATIEGYLRGGVPDIRQLHDECGPTSTANSILWLVDKYNLPKENLPKNPDGSLDQQAILKQLAKAMKSTWNENTPTVNGDRGYPGLDDNELVDGKKKFISDTKLPLAVHGGNTDPNAKAAKSFDFIKSELKNGQDVEFLVFWKTGGAHWVTVVGYSDDGAGKKKIIVHDPDTDKRGNHYWKFGNDGSIITDAGSVGTAGWAVAESPIPEPSSVALVMIGIAMILAGNWKSRRRV